MKHYHGAFASDRSIAIDVIVVSRVCLFRECISRCLADDFSIHVLDACAEATEALASIERLEPDLVLIDARVAGGAATGAELVRAAGRSRIVAVGLEATEANILAWVEAGAAGYIADTASMRDFAKLVRRIRADAGPPMPQVAGSFLDGATLAATGPEAEPALPLTPRERVIQRYIGQGLSNKDIARSLNISVGTTKAHVHNILGKLSLTSRAQVAARFGTTATPLA